MNARERERRTAARSHAKRDLVAALALIVAAGAAWLALVPGAIARGEAGAAMVELAAVVWMAGAGFRFGWRALVMWESE